MFSKKIFSKKVLALKSQYLQNQRLMKVASEGQTFSSTEIPFDVAYGSGNTLIFKKGVIGTICFSNEVFGDPCKGIQKFGYLVVR